MSVVIMPLTIFSSRGFLTVRKSRRARTTTTNRHVQRCQWSQLGPIETDAPQIGTVAEHDALAVRR
jgi:hypothetical protein